VKVHIFAKWSDLKTRKGEGKGRAASLQGREGKVIVSVAACAVGAMTSLPLRVIMYTHTRAQNDGQNNQSLNLLQCSLRSLGRDNKDKIQLNLKISFWWCSVSAVMLICTDNKSQNDTNYYTYGLSTNMVHRLLLH